MSYVASVRSADERFEKIVGTFLDKYMYQPWSQSVKEYDWKRVKERAGQVQGIDIILDRLFCTEDAKGDFSTTIGKVYADEKVAAHFVNSDLRTFALEISFLDVNDEERIGWLFNPEVLTDTYLFMWVYANPSKFPYESKSKEGYTKTTSYFRKMSVEDIEVIQIIGVEREQLHEFLRNKGIDREYAMRIAHEIRNNGWNSRKKRINDVFFLYSPKLKEKPVNIIMNRNKLAKLGNAFFVDCQGVHPGFDEHFPNDNQE